jgi:hypothetical protein
MPRLWLSVWKDELKDQRNDVEDTCLRRWSEILPPEGRVTVLADPGFGNHKLFAYPADLGFAYVIRLRGNICVADAAGDLRTAANWVGRSGRPASCAMLVSPLRTPIRSAPWCVCGHAT